MAGHKAVMAGILPGILTVKSQSPRYSPMVGTRLQIIGTLCTPDYDEGYYNYCIKLVSNQV